MKVKKQDRDREQAKTKEFLDIYSYLYSFEGRESVAIAYKTPVSYPGHDATTRPVMNQRRQRLTS